MKVRMFHQNEIARAIRLICQSSAALAEDVSSGSVLNVGSNALFAAGQPVRLRDSAGHEELTVQQTAGLTTVVVSETIEGEYLMSRGARLQRMGGGLEDLAWVGQGSPDLLPGSPADRYPCVVVKPGTMRQPPGEGSNRTFQQDYQFEVYYVARYEEGQRANIEVLDAAGDLFNLLMEDTYLGGTCWFSQVTEVDPEPREQVKLREREMPLRVVKLTVLARRAAAKAG